MLKEILVDIENCYQNKNYNVQRILEKHNCSHSSLYEKFYGKYNVSPSKYLENKRLEYAIELLANNQCVTFISHKCGYASPRSFRNAIHRRFNTTPSTICLKFKQLSDIEKYEFYQELKNKLWQNGNNYR